MLVVEISLSSNAPSFSLTENNRKMVTSLVPANGSWLNTAWMDKQLTQCGRVVWVLGSLRFDALQQNVRVEFAH